MELKAKEGKAVKHIEQKPAMKVLVAGTMRELVNESNELGISRNDIVFITKENGQFFMIYFK